MKTIEIENCGPVDRLSIPVPEGGGVVVLRSKNGSGKSHCLQAVSALVGGSQKPVSKDGSVGAQVSGLGARITLGRRMAYAGELEVAAIDGEDPSLLVQPNVKSPEAADAARLRALLRLSRARPDVGKFAELLAGGEEELRELCRPASLAQQDDVPAMAASIKRDLETAARKLEAEADNARSEALGIEVTLRALGTSEVTTASAKEAREALEDAIQAHAAGEALIETNQKLITAGNEAEAAIKTLGLDGSAERVKEATDDMERARVHRSRVKAEIEKLEAELNQAELDVERQASALSLQQRSQAQRAAFDRALEAARNLCAEPDLVNLQQTKDLARAEVEAWAVRDRTESTREKAKSAHARADEAQTRGAQLRAAANATESVVLEAVRSVCVDGMEIQDGRLYVRTDRGRELFEELSHGERWRIALEIGCKAVGPTGLLVIRQEAWESLDPINRREIVEHARKIGVVVLTAEADEGEIRAEVA